MIRTAGNPFESRKWFAGVYTPLAGVVFLMLALVMPAPVITNVLQRFHLDEARVGQA